MLIKLFISFLKIGLFSFGGGYAALALIQQEVVVENGWLAVGEFNDLITISQMTPGPIALNSATFVGQRVAGFPGSLAATIGCILPSAIIVGALSYFYKKYKDLDTITEVLKFLRPAIVVMILIAGLDILKTALFDINPVAFENLDIKMLALFLAAFIIMQKKDYDPIKVMLASGAVYLVLGFVVWDKMLYSKKIYKGILRKVLGFLLIILIGFSGLYVYLYYAVDYRESSKNLELVCEEFEIIDTSFKNFLIENTKQIETGLDENKASLSLINEYYNLSNKLGIDYQIDFYPYDGVYFSYGKKKKNYKDYKSYQDIMSLNRDYIFTTSFKYGREFIYVVRARFDNGIVALYVPANNISRKIRIKANGFYINDSYGKVIFNDSQLVENNLDKLNKLKRDFLDKGSYIEQSQYYGDYEIHSLVKRTISNELFIIILFSILGLGALVFGILLASIRGFIEESTEVIARLNKEINMVSEGELDRIDIKTDDEIYSIVTNINKLIDSKKILLDKNVRLKYINKYNEFKMLESQFNPHFLYNTLELISITMYIDPKISDRLIQDLNEILRYSINDLSFIRLDEDIFYIYKFLDIEKIKSEDKFNYEINMDESAGEVLVPKLFLQPLLENSLKYARKTTSNLNLNIRIKRIGNNMTIRIKDNGRVLSASEIISLNHYLEVESKKDYISMKHHGLINTYNRLKMLYKDKVKMGFVEDGDGVIVEIRIGL